MPAPDEIKVETDFFDTQAGTCSELPLWRKRRLGWIADAVYDLRLKTNSSFRSLRENRNNSDVLKVLVLGVNVPARSADLARVFRALSNTRHEIQCGEVPLNKGLGKFQNINRALPDYDVDQFDWLIVVDDDITVPDRFTDIFLDLAQKAELKICMPAHRFHSYQSFIVAQRHWNSLARITGFVECGPLTAFHRDVFHLCLPFPELRWAWGTDVAWSQLASDHGFRIGVVDACPVRHLRPVGASYGHEEALKEAEAFLKEAGVSLSRAEILKTLAVVNPLR